MDIKELLDIVTLKKIDDNRFEGKTTKQFGEEYLEGKF